MSNEIMVAIIGGLCVAVPTIITTIAANNKANTIMQYKIEYLTKQVEKHNGVVERMALAEREINAIWHNVDEIKERESDIKC